MYVLLILIYVAPLLLMAVSLPLIFRKIPKNIFYGFRTRRTLNGTDEYWYEANHKAGLALFVAGAVAFLTAVVLSRFVPSFRVAIRIEVPVLLICVLAATLIALAQDRRSGA
jgi:hypothetical protein